eukprot:15471053-Alexandrium_andersonii.AAC.1
MMAPFIFVRGPGCPAALRACAVWTHLCAAMTCCIHGGMMKHHRGRRCRALARYHFTYCADWPHGLDVFVRRT